MGVASAEEHRLATTLPLSSRQTLRRLLIRLFLDLAASAAQLDLQHLLDLSFFIECYYRDLVGAV
jgi:hypothetical protein